MTYPDYPGRGSFSGSTYDHALDFERLSDQQRRVTEVMSDGKWWTLFDLAWASGTNGHSTPEASVSARIRDLRNVYGQTVERRRSGVNGLWEYRWNLNETSAA